MSIRHDYTPGDSDGLTFNVTVIGGEIWLFRYEWTGKQKRMSLGCYPQISLKEARTRHDEARALVAQGIIPMSTVNRSVVLFVLRQSIPSRPCSTSGWSSDSARRLRSFRSRRKRQKRTSLPS